MPRRLHRYYGSGYLHFITSSCYQRRPLLDFCSAAKGQDPFRPRRLPIHSLANRGALPSPTDGTFGFYTGKRFRLDVCSFSGTSALYLKPRSSPPSASFPRVCRGMFVFRNKNQKIKANHFFYGIRMRLQERGPSDVALRTTIQGCRIDAVFGDTEMKFGP